MLNGFPLINHINIKIMIYNSWDFALFSANIHHFFPHTPWDAHKKIYEQWTEYHKPKFIKSDHIWDLNELLPFIVKQPTILCLFHLGYHAQIPAVLANRNIQFDILIDRNVYELQKNQIKEMKSKLLDQDSFRFLFSDDPQVLIKTRSTLNQGRHLLIFADGNSGTIKDTGNNRVEVQFCGNKIKVRKGIAVLSYLLKIPIIPLTHMNRNNTWKIICGNIISPNIFKTGKEYVVFAMQDLYRFLELQIVDDPYKWESWNYFHELGCIEIGMESYIGNDYRKIEDSWLLLKLNGITGYFDRKNYCFIYLS
jgi:lauroyl/myristoyl acyltransferase